MSFLGNKEKKFFGINGKDAHVNNRAHLLNRPENETQPAAKFFENKETVNTQASPGFTGFRVFRFFIIGADV